MLNILTVGLVLLSAASAQNMPSFQGSNKKFLSDSINKFNFRSSNVNNRPIIGVLTQPLTKDFEKDPQFANKTSYIMQSYISILESAGARTVPLIFDNDLSEELEKLKSLNGVFYCGGGADGPYNVFGKAIFDQAKAINDAGGYLPVWGTCLGFENLAQFVSDEGEDVLTGGYASDDENYKLEFLVDPSNTKLFAPLGGEVEIFEDQAIAYNHHSWGVDPNKFKNDTGLSSIFYPTSLSYDDNGKAFVASMESEKYPFYGVQFHPEKAQFSFYPKTKIDHSDTSIYYNRYFADFFINECKMNNNNFGSYANEQKVITENYDIVVTQGYYGVVYAF